MIKLWLLFISTLPFSFVSKQTLLIADTKLSTISWLGKKTTGEHSGNVSLQSGSLQMDGEIPISGEFVLDMNKITVTDIPDPENNKHLVDHLKNEDFFSVSNYPLATLTIKRFEKIQKQDDKNANTYLATADLTIKGIKNEIQFETELNAKNKDATAVAEIVIDRTKWNISYKSKSVLGGLADKFIYDEIKFNVKIFLSQQN